MEKLLLLTALVSFALAQVNPVSPEQAAREENADVSFKQSGGAVAPANLLQLIYECARPVGSIVNEGKGEMFRVFGFELIDSEVYRLQGTRALTSAVRRAEVRAQGSAVGFFNGVSVYVKSVLGDANDTSTQSASTGAAGSEDRQRLSSVSVSTRQTFLEMTESSSQGYIRNGRVSGTKFISLGGNNGFCVMVRYDIPLAANQPSGQSATPPSQSGVQPNGQNNTPGFPPIAPGKTGDF